MKFTVKNYEIEIKAKQERNSRYNAKDTMHFMNEIAIWLSRYSDYCKLKNEIEPQEFYTGEYGVIRQYQDFSSEIHDQLENLGFYDDLR